MDASELATTAAALIDRLEAELPDGCAIGEVAVIVEVSLKVDDDGFAVPSQSPDEHNATQVTYRCSNDKRWIQGALLQEAADHARNLKRGTLPS